MNEPQWSDAARAAYEAGIQRGMAEGPIKLSPRQYDVLADCFAHVNVVQQAAAA